MESVVRQSGASDRHCAALAATFYRKILLIRRFEESLIDLFHSGQLYGTTHTCSGQEATPVAIAQELTRDDIILGNHRSHGHYLAVDENLAGLYAELMGKATGICRGLGGSQHLHRDNFYTNGVQGNLAPVAVGMALAEKWSGHPGVVVSFMGDGTLGEGTVYESLNMASLHEAPVLYVVENNRWAQTTPVELGVAGSIPDRGKAFGVTAGEIESTDPFELLDYFGPVLARIRERSKPEFHVVHCYRFGPHSKGDDFRDPAEIERQMQRDPLLLLRPSVPAETRERLEVEIRDQLVVARQVALAAPAPDIADLPQGFEA